MSRGGKEGVSVGGKINAGCIRFEIEDGADEGGVLVGKAVVFLSSPGTGFNVVDAADIFSPGGFSCLNIQIQHIPFGIVNRCKALPFC